MHGENIQAYGLWSLVMINTAPVLMAPVNVEGR